MKIAVLLARHRRLLALCGLSACAHLFVLELLALRATVPASLPPAGEALRLRLAAPGASAPAAAHAPAPAASTPAEARASSPAATGEGARAARPAPAAAATPAVPPSSATAAFSPAAAGTATAEPEGAPLVQMPGRYRVRMPEPVRLSYALNRQAPGAAQVVTAPAAGQATLDWRSDGERYALALDGVLGTLRSEGGSSDAGVAPRIAQEERQGGAAVTEFDTEGRRILFRASGASVPDAEGAQDRASVLMQLVGIGLAEPDQIRGQLQNELRIVVAGADGAAIARYLVMGEETVPTALGALQAWRLAEVVPAGRDRVELWLAPERGWLPVQIRVTRADGTALTQTLTRIEPGAPR